MSKPTGFSLSNLPRPAVYGGLGALVLALIAVWYFGTQTGDVVDPNVNLPTTPPAPTSTPTTTTTDPSTTEPTTPVTGTSPPAPTTAGTTGATPPTTASGATITTPVETGPSRSLEVPPIPFLVTSAPKTTKPASGDNQTVSQASPGNRQRVALNPFSSLSTSPSAPTATTPTFTSPPVASQGVPTNPGSTGTPSGLTPVRPAPPVAVNGSGQPLPSFANTPGASPFVGTTNPPVNRPTTTAGTRPATAGTRPTSAGNKPGTTPTITTPKPTSVPKVPTPVATARPQISAPRAAPAVADIPPALGAGPLPVAPGILREVVPQAPEPTPTPIEPPPPPAPDLPSAVVSTPTTTASNTPPSELRPPTPEPASTPTPTPLTSTGNTTPSTTTQTTPPAPPPPPTPPTPTKLDTFIEDRGIAFVGVILGPVNTALIQTKDGVVAVPLGGKIPQSDVVVKSITSTEIELVLGDDTKKLERSKK